MPIINTVIQGGGSSSDTPRELAVGLQYYDQNLGDNVLLIKQFEFCTNNYDVWANPNTGEYFYTKPITLGSVSLDSNFNIYSCWTLNNAFIVDSNGAYSSCFFGGVKLSSNGDVLCVCGITADRVNLTNTLQFFMNPPFYVDGTTLTVGATVYDEYGNPYDTVQEVYNSSIVLPVALFVNWSTVFEFDHIGVDPLTGYDCIFWTDTVNNVTYTTPGKTISNYAGNVPIYDSGGSEVGYVDYSGMKYEGFTSQSGPGLWVTSGGNGYWYLVRRNGGVPTIGWIDTRTPIEHGLPIYDGIQSSSTIVDYVDQPVIRKI